MKLVEFDRTYGGAGAPDQTIRINPDQVCGLEPIVRIDEQSDAVTIIGTRIYTTARTFEVAQDPEDVASALVDYT